MTGKSAALVAAALLALGGCAAQPAADDPNVAVLPHSGLRFAVKDANDRHLTVANGKECEHMADGITAQLGSPGKALAKSTAEGAFEGLWAWKDLPGTALGAAAGALSGNAIGMMNGSADLYGTVVRNCMAGDGHKALD